MKAPHTMLIFTWAALKGSHCLRRSKSKPVSRSAIWRKNARKWKKRLKPCSARQERSLRKTRKKNRRMKPFRYSEEGSRKAERFCRNSFKSKQPDRARNGSDTGIGARSLTRGCFHKSRLVQPATVTSIAERSASR